MLPTPPPDEPDYRFTLANERTFLAWLRTSLALLAAAIAVQSLGRVLDPPWARSALSLACTALSAVTATGGVLRWRAVDRAVRRSEALPPLRLPWLLTAGCLLLAVVAAGVLVAGA